MISYYSYDASTHTLIITFVSGMIYHYKNFPESVYERMKKVSSKGIFFNRYIKDKYEFERIED